MAPPKRKPNRPAFEPERKGAPALLRLLQRVLLVFLILTLPLLLYLGNSEYGYTKTIYAYFSITALYALWGAQAWLEKRLELTLPALWWAAAILLGAGSLSLVNAQAPGITLQSLGVLTYFILLYVYVANAAKDRLSVYLCVGAALLSALFASTYGWLQHQGALPGLPGVQGGTHAMISSFGNKNFLAEFLNLWLLPTLLLLLGLKAYGAKVFALALTTVVFAAFIAADSMGASLGLVGAFLLMGLGMLAFRGAFKALWAHKGWLALWLLALVLVFAFMDKPDFVRVLLSSHEHAAPAQQAPVRLAGVLGGPLDGLQELLARYWRAGSGNTRAWDWWVAYEMFKAYPWFGVGLGHYKVLFVDYKIKFLQTERGKQFDYYIYRAAQAHGDYIQAAAEMGIVGLGAILLALAALGGKALRQLRGQQGVKQLMALVLYSSVTAFLIDALVNFPTHLAASAFSFVLLLGLAHGPYLFPKARVVALRGAALYATLAPFVVFVLGVSVFAYRDWQANVHLDLGNAYLDQGLYRLAREEFEQSLALDFQPAEVLFKLGVVYQALGDLSKAEQYFERSMNSFLVEEVFLPLASIKAQQGKYDDARALIARLLLSKPRDDSRREAEFLSAFIEIQAGNTAQALAQLQALQEKYPHSDKVYAMMGNVVARQGDIRQALPYYRRALDIVETRLAGSQAQWNSLQGQTITSQRFAQLRASIENDTKLREELQRTIAQLEDRLPP